MTKREMFTEFIKFDQSKKEGLTLKWLTTLVKTHNLTIEDVMDILNCVDLTFSKLDKLNSLLTKGRISATAISRILGYGYARSMNYINTLLKRNIIVKFDNSYKIIDKERFKLANEELIKGDDYERKDN